MKKCLIIMTTLLICGCGAALNPYKDDFSCPSQDKGKCIRVEGAYKESLQKKSGNILNDKENKMACEKCREEAKKNNVSEAAYCSSCYAPQAGKPENRYFGNQPSETVYQNAVNKKLAAMLERSDTPLVAPPQVMRILILPYKGDMNELYMTRYVYLLVDDPKWVMGNYLMNSDE